MSGPNMVTSHPVRSIKELPPECPRTRDLGLSVAEILRYQVEIIDNPETGLCGHERKFYQVDRVTGKIIREVEPKFTQLHNIGNKNILLTNIELDQIDRDIRQRQMTMSPPLRGGSPWSVRGQLVNREVKVVTTPDMPGPKVPSEITITTAKPTVATTGTVSEEINREVKTVTFVPEIDNFSSANTLLKAELEQVGEEELPKPFSNIENKLCDTRVLADAVLTDKVEKRPGHAKTCLIGVHGLNKKFKEAKDSALFKEFTNLSSCQDKQVCRDSLDALNDRMPEGVTEIDPKLLKAIADVLTHTKPEDLSPDTLNKLLLKLEERLESVLNTDEPKMMAVLITLNKILDVMGDANVHGVSYNKVTSKVYKTLEKIEKNPHVSVYVQAEAGRGKQALLRIEHDQSDLKRAMFRLYSLTRGIDHLYHGVTDISVTEIVSALKDFKKAFAQEEKSKKWYSALRYLETLIKIGKLDNFDKELSEILPQIDSDHFHFVTFSLISKLSDAGLFAPDLQNRIAAYGIVKKFFNYHKDKKSGPAGSKDKINGPFATLVSHFSENQKNEMCAEILLQFKQFASPYNKDDRTIRDGAREHLKEVINESLYSTIVKLANMEDWTDDTIDNLPLFRDKTLKAQSSALIEYIKSVEMNITELIGEMKTNAEKSEFATFFRKKFVLPEAEDENGNPVDLRKEIDEFLKNGVGSLVFKGATGAGKSILALYLDYLIWSEKDSPDSPLSAYIPLETHFMSSDKMLEKSYQNFPGLRVSDRQADALVADPTLSHVCECDSFDEWGRSDNLALALKVEKLGKKSRVIAFVRDQAIDMSLQESKTPFMTTVNGKVVDSPVKVLTLKKWDRKMIKKYIEKNLKADDAPWKQKTLVEIKEGDASTQTPKREVKEGGATQKLQSSQAVSQKPMETSQSDTSQKPDESEEDTFVPDDSDPRFTRPYRDWNNWKIYELWMDQIEGLEEMMENPLMCDKVMQALPVIVERHKSEHPGQQIKLVQYDIYKECMYELHKRQLFKLSQAGTPLQPYGKIFQQFKNYDMSIAASVYWNKDKCITYAPEVEFGIKDDKDKDPNRKYFSFFEQNPQKPQVKIEVLRSGSFVQRMPKTQNKYEFMHITWFYFFVAQFILSAIEKGAIIPHFFKREITNPILLNSLVQMYNDKPDPKIREKYGENPISTFKQKIDSIKLDPLKYGIGAQNAAKIIAIAKGEIPLPKVDTAHQKADPSVLNDKAFQKGKKADPSVSNDMATPKGQKSDISGLKVHVAADDAESDGELSDGTTPKNYRSDSESSGYESGSSNMSGSSTGDSPFNREKKEFDTGVLNQT